MAALLLGLAIPFAHAGNAFNDNFPVAGPIDPCTGDPTTFSGNFHLVANVTTSSNGGFHVVVHDNLDNTTSVDTVTGVTCRAMNSTVGISGTFSFNTSSGAATTHTSTNDAQTICPGPNNNSLFHFVTHVTVNANGDVTAAVSDMTLRCGQ